MHINIVWYSTSHWQLVNTALNRPIRFALHRFCYNANIARRLLESRSVCCPVWEHVETVRRGAAESAARWVLLHIRAVSGVVLRRAAWQRKTATTEGGRREKTEERNPGLLTSSRRSAAFFITCIRTLHLGPVRAPGLKEKPAPFPGRMS